jgi:formate-dependent nitrite reductase membrane component NrfD
MNTLLRLRSPRAWLHGLIAAFVGGGASAITTDQGFILAERLGVDVPTLNLNALGIVFLTSGLSSAAMYLKQSPLPPIEAAPEKTSQP